MHAPQVLLRDKAKRILRSRGSRVRFVEEKLVALGFFLLLACLSVVFGGVWGCQAWRLHAGVAGDGKTAAILWTCHSVRNWGFAVFGWRLSLPADG